MAIASLVLGIVSLVLCVFGFGFPLGTILSIVGIILGILAKKQLTQNGQPVGMATAGFVLSIIALVLSLIFFIACAACVGTGASFLNSL